VNLEVDAKQASSRRPIGDSAHTENSVLTGTDKPNLTSKQMKNELAEGTLEHKISTLSSKLCFDTSKSASP
jgi:protein tyrosine phosphatase